MDIETVSKRVLKTTEIRTGKVPRNEFFSIERKRIKVVLDRIEHHYNIGAIFRLCDAMLVEEMVTCGMHVNLKNRKLVQAARGTQKWVPWRSEKSTLEVVQKAKSEGYQIVIVEQSTNSIGPECFAPKLPVCLVLGAEFNGIAQDIADLADLAIEIPIFGMTTSINVATAAAIVLYELVRKIST